MLTFFQRLLHRRNDVPDSTPPETDPERMSLEERMAYRREMLYQSIRECLLQLQVISSMYKFRIMNLDARQHRFIAMIEVTNSFEAKMGGIPVGFNQIEAFIQKRTFERYNVRLESIFWRVNEVESAFVRSQRAGEGANARAASGARQPEVAGDVSAARQRLSRAQAEASHLGAISVQHLDYQSEHAPLQPGEQSGGTQYGQL